MNEYYLQLAVVVAGERSWEKVDEYTYLNWANAINAEGQSRYSGKRFSKSGGAIHLCMISATEGELAIAMRILGVKPDTTATVVGGFYKTPEYVKFTRGKTTVLHEMEGGTYRLSAA